MPVVAVYHPDQGNDFVNVGWAGWIATIAGEYVVCCAVCVGWMRQQTASVHLQYAPHWTDDLGIVLH